MQRVLNVCRNLSKLFWRIALFALVTSSVSAQWGSQLEPTDRPVALSGVLRIVRGFGPPGWGESKREDSQMSYWVIDVFKRVRVKCPQYLLEQRDPLCAGTKRLRLVVVSDELRAVAGRLSGKRVVAHGFLRLQKSVEEMTPVYMEVIELTPGSRAKRPR